jgi:phage shock protein E
MKKLLILMMVFIGFAVQAEPVYWIDVRTNVEHSMGHLEGSVNIPHGNIAEKIAAITEDKNANIHLYCRSGGRADKALQTLQGLGYTQAVNEGGYDDIVEKMKTKSVQSKSNRY